MTNRIYVDSSINITDHIDTGSDSKDSYVFNKNNRQNPQTTNPTLPNNFTQLPLSLVIFHTIQYFLALPGQALHA